jgi:hypothetical protein
LIIIFQKGKNTVSLIRPIVFLFLVYIGAKLLVADPLLWMESENPGNSIIIFIKGKNMPTANSVRIKLSYDDKVFSIMDAIISSQLPGTAFGATADTLLKILTVNIIGFAPFIVEDNKEIVKMTIPINQNIMPTEDLKLTYGLVVDQHGVSHPATPDTRIGFIAGNEYKGSEPQRPLGLYSLSGRRLPQKTNTPGTYVIRGRKGSASRIMVKMEK